jgi:hypothetical protein
MTRTGLNCALKIPHQAMAVMEDEARRVSAALDEPEWVQDYFASHKDRLALDCEWFRANVPRQARILELGAYPFFVTRALMAAGFAVQTVDHPAPQVSDLAQRLAVSSASCDIERELDGPCARVHEHGSGRLSARDRLCRRSRRLPRQLVEPCGAELSRLVPSLRPYFSCIAYKPA